MKSNKDLLKQVKVFDEMINIQKEEAESCVDSLNDSINDMKVLLGKMKEYYESLEVLNTLLPEMNPENQDTNFQFTENINSDYSMSTDNMQLVFQGIIETAAKLEELNKTIALIKQSNLQK